jgi:hypothetical protein
MFVLAPPPRGTRREAPPPPPEGRERKKSLSGMSRINTLVCCEFSRAKQFLAGEISYDWLGSSFLINAY